MRPARPEGVDDLARDARDLEPPVSMALLDAVAELPEALGDLGPRFRVLQIRCNPRRPERVTADRCRDPGSLGTPREHLLGAVPVEAAVREGAVALE